MSLEVCRTVKNILSESLLVPNAPTSVFGVGVGIERNCDVANELVLGVKYHIRVYTDSPDDREILPNVTGSLRFPEQKLFPIKGRFENTDIEIRCVKAPKPRFGMSPVNYHTNACNINGDGRLELDDEGKLAEQDIFSGIEIRLGEDGRSGTLGYFVKKGGAYYALSNSHVIAAFGDPGTTDVYYSSYKIATLDEDLSPFKIEFGNLITIGNKQKFHPYKMDAAIAKLDLNLRPKREIINKGKLLISGTFPDLDKNGRTDPKKSYRVTKHGFFSCETGSWIDDVDCDFVMDDSNSQLESDKVKFVNQFRVVRTTKANVLVENQNSSFAGPGDSGSLVFDNKKIGKNKLAHRAIGLLFAIGTDQDFENISLKAQKDINGYAVITPISVLKKELDVEFICDVLPK
jgi:hypothetical protein